MRWGPYKLYILDKCAIYGGITSAGIGFVVGVYLFGVLEAFGLAIAAFCFGYMISMIVVGLFLFVYYMFKEAWNPESQWMFLVSFVVSGVGATIFYVLKGDGVSDFIVTFFGYYVMCISVFVMVDGFVRSVLVAAKSFKDDTSNRNGGGD